MARTALILSIFATVLAAAALLRGGADPILGQGDGVDAYDFSTPEAAWRSAMEIDEREDLRAMIELGRLVRREQRETSKLEDSAEFEERHILFVMHEEDGKPKYRTIGMKKLLGTDMWVQDYVSHYDVRKKDKALADRMEAWQEKGKD